MGLANLQGEYASRNASEPDSASIGIRRWPVRPTRMKPDKTDREATGICSDRTFRGGWGQRAWKDQPRSLGGPVGWEAKATNAPREYIIAARPGRESERPIVAEKRGNAHGAKGPY
jgi:hypothetical protein